MSRKPLLLVGIGELVIAGTLTACFVRTTALVQSLQHDARTSRTRYAEAQQAKQIMAASPRVAAELLKREELFARTIPRDEQEPLEFVKQLTLLAEAAGAQHLSFTVQPRQALQSPRAPAPLRADPTLAPAAFSLEENGAGDARDRRPRRKRGANTGAQSAAEPSEWYLTPIQLECDLDFPGLIAFLASVRAQERLTTIEAVTVTRAPDLAPRQQVTLTVGVYTTAAAP